MRKSVVCISGLNLFFQHELCVSVTELTVTVDCVRGLHQWEGLTSDQLPYNTQSISFCLSHI